MNMNNIFNVMGAIVTATIVATVVTSPQTANIIRSIGVAFASSLRAAVAR